MSAEISISSRKEEKALDIINEVGAALSVF